MNVVEYQNARKTTPPNAQCAPSPAANIGPQNAEWKTGASTLDESKEAAASREVFCQTETARRK